MKWVSIETGWDKEVVRIDQIKRIYPAGDTECEGYIDGLNQAVRIKIAPWDLQRIFGELNI